jgi:hypothetical protein
MVTMSGGNFNQRLRGFMKSGDEEELKLKREWHYVELRKNKRTEQTLKRRRLWGSESLSVFNSAELAEQLAGVNGEIDAGNQLKGLVELEAVGRREDLRVFEMIVGMGFAGKLIGMMRESKDPAIVSKAVEILCDILATVPESLPIDGLIGLVDLSLALLEERQDLSGLLALVISNLVTDRRCQISQENLTIWSEKVLSSLRLESNEDKIADKLWCLGSFLFTDQLSVQATERIISVLRHYCELPCNQTWAPPLVRCLKTLPSESLCRPEVVNYLLKSLLIFPSNGTLYELLKEAFSSSICSADRLYTVLDYSLVHEKTSTRRYAYDLLYYSLDFYEDIRADAVVSKVWKTAVKGIADQDGYIQMAAANFYSSFDGDYSSYFADIMEDLLVNLHSLDVTQDSGAQLVSAI